MSSVQLWRRRKRGQARTARKRGERAERGECSERGEVDLAAQITAFTPTSPLAPSIGQNWLKSFENDRCVPIAKIASQQMLKHMNSKMI